MNQNPFVAWFQELMQRFATKSPKFFRILQYVSGGITAIAGLPALLAAYHIPLPDAFTFLQNKYAGLISLGFFLASLLPTQNKIIGVDEKGKPLTTTNEKDLPFTAQHEEKKVEEKKAVTVLTPDSIVPNPVSQRTDPNP
jgi:hypothetical protein